MQFTYRPQRGAEDIKITLLSLIVKHLDRNASHVRLGFVDFSLAFSTIQPHILIRQQLAAHGDACFHPLLFTLYTNTCQQV